MAKTVLIVEDDRNIADLLRLYLEKEGYTVVIAPDGMRGVEQFRTVHPSLVLLDVMLPGLDGWGVCRAIRAESQTPIIMLTAKSETEDKVNGLKQGADDYITKPFEMKEVLARIEAVLRRSGIEPEKSRRRLEFDKLIIDMDAFELTVDGKKVPTPPKEMELLYHLASTPNRVSKYAPFYSEVFEIASPVFGEALPQSSAAYDGAFPPIHRFEKLDVHKVRLHFPNLDSTKNLSPSALAD